MIKFLSNWVEQIVIAIIIASIFEMILPKNNLGKYIKMILGIYIVFNIISPFVNSEALYKFGELNIDTISKDFNIQNTNEVNQESMDIRLNKLYIEQIETNIKSKIEDMGYKTERCKVDANLDANTPNAGINRIDLILTQKQEKNQIEKVEVNEIVISSILRFKKNENEDKCNEIRTELAKYYGIDKSIINIKMK